MKTLCTTFLLILTCAIFPLNSQVQEVYAHYVDSLKTVIPTLEGKEKLDAFNKLLNIFVNFSLTDQLVKEYLLISDAASVEAQKQGDMKESGRNMINTVNFLSNNSQWEELDERKKKYLDFTFRNALWDYYYAIQSRYIEGYYLKTGQTDRAIREAEELYEIAKTTNHPQGILASRLGIARALSSQRRFAEAETYYEQGLKEYGNQKITPPYIEGWWSYCTLLNDTEQNEKAIDMIAQFEKISHRYMEETNQPNPYLEAVVLRLYAFAYCRMGQLTEAVSYVNKADSLSQDLIGMSNSYSIKTEIAVKQGKYNLAFGYIAKLRELRKSKLDYNDVAILQMEATIWSGIENAVKTLEYSEKAFRLADSLSQREFNQKLDELRTKYEVDTNISEKEKLRGYMYFSVALSLFLLVVMGIWIYFNHKITWKNKVLVSQISELQAKHEQMKIELLNKTTFEKQAEEDLIPKSNRDRLCIRIRDMLLKEKAYRNPALTRDSMVERLGTNKGLFLDAFQHCFGMSVSEYITFLRMNDAITLLEKSDLVIESVSEQVGFGTVRTFQRQFQSKYNMSPKDYRKAIRK